MPYALHRMDFEFEDRFRDLMKLKPSEYWRRQCKATFQFDPIGAKLVDDIGVETMMWGSDYPHTDGVWPESSKYIEEQFAGLAPEIVHKITCENAAKFYRLSIASLQAAPSGKPSPAGGRGFSLPLSDAPLAILRKSLSRDRGAGLAAAGVTTMIFISSIHRTRWRPRIGVGRSGATHLLNSGPVGGAWISTAVLGFSSTTSPACSGAASTRTAAASA